MRTYIIGFIEEENKIEAFNSIQEAEESNSNWKIIEASIEEEAKKIFENKHL